MRYTLIPLALVATATAQGVTETIAPPGASPPQCVNKMDGKYELTVDAIDSGKMKRQEPVTNTLLVTLENGVLQDRYKRVGYIASNYQFQFDGPPQAGALFTGGWTLCSNGSLALGPSTIFYRCLSGDFYNLYDRNWAAQCGAIHLSAHQASPEVVNEVPPAAGGAAPKPAPAPDAPVTTTTPVVVVPPSTPTPTDAPATSGSSVPASVSPVSTPPAAAGNGTLGPVVIPSPAPPVDPAQAGTGNMVHVGTAAGSSIAAVLALFALVMV